MSGEMAEGAEAEVAAPPARKPRKKGHGPEKPMSRAANPFDKHMGVRLKTARRYRKVTCTQLARRLDLFWLTIANFENGRRRVPAELVAIYSKLLRVPITFFYDGII